MTIPLWIRDDVFAAVDGTSGSNVQRPHWEATGVSIDSRDIQPGDLFIAIQGPNADGHDYVEAAFKAGAVAAVVHRPVNMAMGHLVLVRDTLEALENLARFARARLSSEAKVCAVTGSVGKTGTKDMLVHVLSEQGKTASTRGNLNNHWGLPLSLARVPADCKFVVLELGMNHAGELLPLTAIARPHAAIVTTVEAVHMEFFQDVTEIADAKAEIFTGLEPDGFAIINADNEFKDRLFKAARRAGTASIRTFGAAPDADARMVEWQPHDDGSTVTVEINGLKLAYRIPALGRHIALNSTGVLATVLAVGADVVRAAQSISESEAPKGRGSREMMEWGGGFLAVIDDSYNASPIAVKAALHALTLEPVSPGGRRVVILGDMLELGDQSNAYHAGLSETCVDTGADLVFTAGPLMQNLFDALPQNLRGGCAATSTELAPLVAATLRPDDVALVKGSKGSRMGVVIDAIRAAAASHQKTAVNGD